MDDIDTATVKNVMKLLLCEIEERTKNEMKQTITQNLPILGDWNKTYLVWTYPRDGTTMWLLNKLHKILDPEHKLPRMITYERDKMLYCKKCKKVTHKRTCICGYQAYTTFSSYAIKHNKLNWIEHTVFVNDMHYYCHNITQIKHHPISRNINMKRRQITFTDGKLCITPERDKSINSHVFINIDISRDDIDHYNIDVLDSYLLELLNGSIETYNTFIRILYDILMHDRCELIFVVGSDENKQLIIDIINGLFGLYTGIDKPLRIKEVRGEIFEKIVHIISYTSTLTYKQIARYAYMVRYRSSPKYTFILSKLSQTLYNDIINTARTEKYATPMKYHLIKLSDKPMLPVQRSTLVNIVLYMATHESHW